MSYIWQKRPRGPHNNKWKRWASSMSYLSTYTKARITAYWGLVTSLSLLPYRSMLTMPKIFRTVKYIFSECLDRAKCPRRTIRTTQKGVRKMYKLWNWKTQLFKACFYKQHKLWITILFLTLFPPYSYIILIATSRTQKCIFIAQFWDTL